MINKKMVEIPLADVIDGHAKNQSLLCLRRKVENSIYVAQVSEGRRGRRAAQVSKLERSMWEEDCLKMSES